MNAGRYHDAFPVMERMLRLKREGRTGDPSIPRIIVRNMDYAYDEGGENRYNGRFLAREYRVLYGQDGLDTMPSYQAHRYGLAFLVLEQRDSARHWLERALLHRDSLQPRHRVITLVALAELARDELEAKQHLDQVARLRAQHPDVSRAALSVYLITHARGTREAIHTLVRAELDSVGYGKSPTHAIVRQLIAAAHALNRAGDYDAAREYATDAIDGTSKDPLAPSRSSRFGSALVARADAELGLGDTTSARRTLRDAMNALKWGLGDNHPFTASASTRLTELR